MRMITLALAAVALAACATPPAPATASAADRAAEAEAIANLPDFKPETVAACNAVPLRVSLAASGALTVNDQAADIDGLKAAAGRKNEACRNAPAMVIFSAPPNTPASVRESTLNTLAGIIVNIAVVETAS
jgi:hypothetical protein